jgi:hypothetical protein
MRQAQEHIERLEQAIRVVDWSLADVVTALPMPWLRPRRCTIWHVAGRCPGTGSLMNPRFLLVADRKIDARSQTQDSPRRTSGHAAQIRGSEFSRGSVSRSRALRRAGC